MKTIFDPPSGWKYGFPKEIPSIVMKSDDPSVFRKWLITSGYPEKDVDFAMRNGKQWTEKEDE